MVSVPKVPLTTALVVSSCQGGLRDLNRLRDLARS